MDERFWIDDNPIKKPFGENTCGLVDEEKGGVIAYFGSLELAQSALALLDLYKYDKLMTNN